MKLQHVPAKTGWLWVRAGIRTFGRQPLAMGGLFLMFMMLVSLLNAIPMLGMMLSLALLPAATLGLMVATQQASEGLFPMPSVLASAFRAGQTRLKSMAVLGVAYALAFGLIMAITTLFDDGVFARMYMGIAPMDPAALEESNFIVAMWVGMLLYLPTSMLFWHAPALVHWHGITPIKSLFFSLMACWHNKGAMSVYMLGWLGVFVLVASALSVLGGLLGPGMIGVLLFPTILVLAAMFFASFYFTYRDSFSSD